MTMQTWAAASNTGFSHPLWPSFPLTRFALMVFQHITLVKAPAPPWASTSQLAERYGYSCSGGQLPNT